LKGWNSFFSPFCWVDFPASDMLGVAVLNANERND
jgi:hypothetical protein